MHLGRARQRGDEVPERLAQPPLFGGGLEASHLAAPELGEVVEQGAGVQTYDA